MSSNAFAKQNPYSSPVPQVWLPDSSDDDEVMLKTKGMPFCVAGFGDLLALFRCISCRFSFGIDPTLPDQLGAPGRVFTSALPELSCNVQQYSRDRYLRLAEAEQCNVQSSLLLPIFIMHDRCVAVLEAVQTSADMDFVETTAKIAAAFRAVGLETTAVEVIKQCLPRTPVVTNLVLPNTTYILGPRLPSSSDGSGVDVSSAQNKEEAPQAMSEISEDVFSEDDMQDDSEDGDEWCNGSPRGRNGTRRKGKAGKPGVNISLKALQGQFGVGLKEAANRLGVCPTTLKRACRRHGIQRWPRRALQKVSRALDDMEKKGYDFPPPSEQGITDNRWTALANFIPAYKQQQIQGFGQNHLATEVHLSWPPSRGHLAALDDDDDDDDDLPDGAVLMRKSHAHMRAPLIVDPSTLSDNNSTLGKPPPQHGFAWPQNKRSQTQPQPLAVPLSQQCRIPASQEVVAQQKNNNSVPEFLKTQDFPSWTNGPLEGTSAPPNFSLGNLSLPSLPFEMNLGDAAFLDDDIGFIDPSMLELIVTENGKSTLSGILRD